MSSCLVPAGFPCRDGIPAIGGHPILPLPPLEDVSSTWKVHAPVIELTLAATSLAPVFDTHTLFGPISGRYIMTRSLPTQFQARNVTRRTLLKTAGFMGAAAI